MSDQLRLLDLPTPDTAAALRAALSALGVGNHIGRPSIKRPVEQVTVKAHDSGHVVVWVSRLDRDRVYVAVVSSKRGKRLLRRAQLMQRLLLEDK